MPKRGCCRIFIPTNVFCKTSNFLLPLKEMKVFYLRNAACGKMVLVGTLRSDLMPEFVLLKKNKVNKTE
jgi:hypothetical protein